MRITIDPCHVSKALSQLGYNRFTFSDLRCYGGVTMPAFIFADEDIQSIFETSSAEYDYQPVFTIHVTSKSDSADIELKWIGAKALLALSTADPINVILRRQMNSFPVKEVGGKDLIEAIKDVDHLFVTPDIYLEHK